MDKIELKHTLPRVFAQRTDIDSDIWNKDMTLERGKTYLIEANSGTGKSSFCSYIYGYRKDYEGTILFDDEDISTFGINKWVDIRRTHFALLWQELRLFSELTAMENVEIKNKLTHHQSRAQIDTWFDMLGIADKKDVKIGRISFGQQQRVAMIRTLCQPFDFAFVDEPISHLDDTNSAIMASILTAEASKQGAGIVATSIGKHMEMRYDKVFQL